MMECCPDCGQLQRLATPRGGRSVCVRCGSTLEWKLARGLADPLALSLAAAVLLAVAASEPLLAVGVAGRTLPSGAASGLAVLVGRGWWPLAGVVAAAAVLVPFGRLLSLAVVLALVWQGHHGPGVRRLLRASEALQPWAMAEVFLLAALVAYGRLNATAQTHVGVGGWALACAAVAAVAAEALLDRRAVWRELGPPSDAVAAEEAWTGCRGCGRVALGHKEGTRCPRCGRAMWDREPGSSGRTWAFVTTAAILYAPANLLPIMVLVSFQRVTADTILGGVRQLAASGDWPLAAVVVTASFAVPLLKLAGLTALLLAARRPDLERARSRTRLYRVIDAVGRWSMLDVFALSLLAGAVRFGGVARIEAGAAAPAFAAVVVSTMLAAQSFDPRRLWPDGRGPIHA